MKRKYTIAFILLILVSVAYAATRNVVPRADGEGGLGTSAKNWLSAYIDTVFTNILTLTDQNASPDAVGELQYDNTVTGWDDGALCWYDDDEIKYLIDLATLPSNDDYVVAYDSAIDKFYMKTDADSGGATAYDDIGDPDAAGSISFDDGETATYTGANDGAISFFNIVNSDADHTGGNMYLLDLDYSGDDGDADADFIKLQDSGGVLMTIQEEGKIVMTPGGVGPFDAISVTPSAAISTNEAPWNAILIDGSALDPSGDDIVLCGLNVNMSGVVFGGTGGDIDGIGINMAGGEDHAIHISQGKFVAENTVAATAGAEFTIFDVQVHTAAMNANSSIHAIDVATPETPAGTVVAMGTHSNVEVIQQSIGTFSTPNQTEYAGEKHTGGTVWADGVDTSEIFIVDDDEVYVGSTAQFGEIDVIMTTPGSKTVTPTFHYNTATDTWTEFFPADDTDGFQQSGIIRWTLADISGSWTNDGDPCGVDTSTGYWIKIIRTANADPGTPTPTTVKTGAITSYSWSKTGAIDVLSMEADTITEGGIAVHNNDQMDASSELLSIFDDETGTGVIVFGTSPSFTTSILAVSQADIGSTSAEFGDIFIGDGKAAKFGDDQDVTLTHVADTGLLLNLELEIDGTLDADGVVALGDGGDNFSVASDGIDIDTSGNITNAGTIASGIITVTGVINTSVGLDAVGAVDMDYGSADVTDHTFTTDDMTFIMDGGITVSTGDFIKIGTTQWNSADEIDGTKIKDADYGDVTIDAGGDWDVENAQTVTVADDESTDDDQEIVFTTDNATLESDGDFHYSPDTGTITATEFAGGGASLTSIDAATGDSATAFFDAGTIEHEYGGLEADINAYTGLVAITGGSTAEVDAKSELEGHIADVADFAEADGDTWTGVHDAGGATSFEIPNAADPDLTVVGQISQDTDGGNEPNDVSLRAFEGADTQYVLARTLKTLNFTLIEPDQIDAYDLIPVWHNTSGYTFTVVEWKAWSDDDNVSFEIEELTDMTNFSAITQVDACEIATDGTSVFYGSDTTITHATIEHDHSLAIDFDGATDTPDYVQISITGWFNADVN